MRTSDFSVGSKLGKWTILELIGKDKHGKRLYLCECDCGVRRHVPHGNLLSGASVGCFGCRRRLPKHGMTGTRPYHSWADMVNRCTNKRYRWYYNYGGRGISVCNEWKSFDGFWRDMGPYYEDGLTLDRINNDGDYGPGNCRWVNKVIQNNNKRTNILVTIGCRVKTLTQWCHIYGINPNRASTRVRRDGWDHISAIMLPVNSWR